MYRYIHYRISEPPSPATLGKKLPKRLRLQRLVRDAVRVSLKGKTEQETGRYLDIYPEGTAVLVTPAGYDEENSGRILELLSRKLGISFEEQSQVGAEPARIKPVISLPYVEPR